MWGEKKRCCVSQGLDITVLETSRLQVREAVGSGKGCDRESGKGEKEDDTVVHLLRSKERGWLPENKEEGGDKGERGERGSGGILNMWVY